MTRVAIIGRANVGKSTLFNRLSEKMRALVSDISGTTRDLKYAKILWRGINFTLIDTGGFLAGQKTTLKNLTKKEKKKIKHQTINDIDKQVEAKAKQALMTSKLVIFVVDAKQGLNPQDKEIADYLRKIKDKDIILVVNKCDNQKIRNQVADFYKLGLDSPLLVSAINGSGTGDLLDAVTKHLKKDESANEQISRLKTITVSILGKPNVGKSSLLNKLIGEEKAIVSDIPHTTREPNDTLIEYDNQQILLVDTAGIRRKARVPKNSLESLGIMMSIKTLKKSKIALLVLDINQPISHQDLRLGKLTAEAGVSVIIVANKYDLIKNFRKQEINALIPNENSVKEYTNCIYQSFPHLNWAPVVFISAKTGWNTEKILKLILQVNKQTNIRIPDGALSKLLKNIIKKQPPPRKKIGFGKKTKIKRSFITNFKQIEINPPLFECTIGSKEKLPENYRQFILNNLRSKFGFKGVPIRLVVRYKKI